MPPGAEARMQGRKASKNYVCLMAGASYRVKKYGNWSRTTTLTDWAAGDHSATPMDAVSSLALSQGQPAHLSSVWFL